MRQLKMIQNVTLLHSRFDFPLESELSALNIDPVCFHMCHSHHREGYRTPSQSQNLNACPLLLAYLAQLELLKGLASVLLAALGELTGDYF